MKSNRLFDQWFFWLVMLLAALPFGQVIHVRMPGITLNAFELIYLALLCVLSAKIMFNRELKEPFLAVFFILIAMLYILGSREFYSVSSKMAVVHFREYLPFLVALLLFSTGTSVATLKWLKGFVIAAGLSGFIALCLHHFSPSFIQSSFSASEEIAITSMYHGRMYWANANLAFFVLLAWFCKEFEIEKRMLLIAAILSFVAMFNTLNRTMLIGYALFYIVAIFISESFQAFLRRFLLFFVVVSGFVVIVIMLSSFDERIAALIELRFFGSGDSSEVYQVAVVEGRYGLYEQYMQSIVQHFPMGQGLGTPFFVSGMVKTYTTDVSFLAFLLPFGLVGLFIFGLFVYKVFVKISRSKRQISKKTRKYIFLFVVIFMLMSFNIDFFSRNSFVIYLVVLVLSLRNSMDGANKTKPILRKV